MAFETPPDMQLSYYQLKHLNLHKYVDLQYLTWYNSEKQQLQTNKEMKTIMKTNKIIPLVTALCISLSSVITAASSVNAVNETPEYTTMDEIHGINDSVFSIARPDETTLTAVNASKFGLSADAEDNTQAMRDAFIYCRQHPNTRLIIDNGVYHFSPDEDIYLNRLQNTLIDANDAEFIFSTPHYFKVYACDNVEIRNMIIDWNWDTLRLGSLVKIENENDAENTLEIEFTELDEVSADIPLLSFMQYDPADLVAGVHGSFKIYSPSVDPQCIKKVEKVSGRPNVLRITHSGALDYFRNDEVYLLRHYIYGAQVFNTVEESSNITYNNISIYGACGMGYVFAYGANHYQIINSYIGLRPGAEDKYRISTTADGIHVSNSAGYFRIDNCDLSFCGDDIINVHDNMFYIESIDESRKIMHGTCPNKIVETGHRLKFMDPDFNSTDYEATVVSITRNGYEAEITLTEPLPANITADMVAYNSGRDSANYVLTNNYIHETKGRGILLNSDNGLCDGNTFYRTCSQTLQVRTEIPSDRVIEGTGADHIQISSNKFIECNFGGRGDVITIESLLNGKRAENTPLSEITVKDNQFTSCYQEVIDADNVNGLTIENNIIRDCENYSIGEHCKNVSSGSNLYLPAGDVNADGEFNISDLITLQKWFLSVSDTELKDWQSADLCRDGRLNVLDFCLMKEMLID